MIEIILSFAAVVAAIILHEVSHGYAALALGDDTARRMGRLSLNPIAHVDRVGTLIVPGVLLVGQAMGVLPRGVFFGWAKPVPIAAWRFSDPRRGMMLVAAAGPLANFVLAWLSLLALYLTPSLPDAWRAYTIIFLSFFLVANLVLGTFNLLPFPPLDGGRIVVGLLPERAAMAWAQLERAGLIIVIVLVFLLPQALREFGILFDPLRWWLHTVSDPILRLILSLAGHPTDLRYISPLLNEI